MTCKMLHSKHCCTEIFTIFIILFIQECSAFDFRNSNIQDVIYIRNVTSINQSNVASNISSKKFITNTPIFRSTGKKWKVGRVSRQQYEIINMLWRKTNLFGDELNTLPKSSYTERSDTQEKDNTQKIVERLTPNSQISDRITSIPQNYQRNIFVKNVPTSHPSTMSYIEFYYLDESADSTMNTLEKKLNEYIKTKIKISDKASGRLGQFKNFVSRSPLFAFRLNDPAYKRISHQQASLHSTTSCDTIHSEPKIEMKMTTKNNFLQRFLTRNMAPRYVRPISNTKETKQSTTPTLSDRVKFFEMYDSDTRITENVNTTNSYKDNEISEEKIMVLEQVDKDVGHGPNQIRYAKKHVKGKDMAQNFTQFVKSLVKLKKLTETSTEFLKTEKRILKTSTMTPTWDDVFHYTSKIQTSAAWSTYPFAAVYVYERYQVHCDAAAISPYWLVSSAACISRHREDPEGDRSAFIAYCGESWWNPERIAYVKYTLVHPRYHPKDTARRYLYNIGVIQVASSMSSSCPGWAPVSIMSHQHLTETTGSLGSAVGWGLNRYDTSYTSRDLPRHPLSVYESYIFANNCPGNSGYRNMKRVSEQAVSNVYCLALPAYTGEDKDPVHGGLLIVGGKLIALYLQEERRRWGDQSAQYTGIWRLIPWVLDVAKDPEDMDFSLIR